MTADHLQELVELLVEKRPFHPFTIELVGGELVEIDHPRAMIARDGNAFVMKPGGVPAWFDHDSVLQVISDIANASR
jgi:hypothetical protein